MKLPISYYGDPILRKQGKLIEKITPEIIELAHNMIETMDANNGVGLAANQVGQELKLFVLRNPIITEEGHLALADPQFFINPKITYYNKEIQIDPEPCISIPGISANVERPTRIIVEAIDLNGEIFVEAAEGYKARVIMHENDHVNGVLFIDRVSEKDRKRLEPELRALKKKLESRKR